MLYCSLINALSRRLMTYKLCIVEDHDWLREMFTNYLNQQPDLEVAAAFASGEECLNNLSTDTDLILVDLSLKGMSGIELIKIIRERWPTIPYIIVSGESAVELARLGKLLAAAYCIDKGDIESLLAAIYDVVKAPKRKNLP